MSAPIASAARIIWIPADQRSTDSQWRTSGLISSASWAASRYTSSSSSSQIPHHRKNSRQRSRPPAESRVTSHESREPRGPMSFEDPVIITNSISGVVANREQCPAIPYTPAEYAAEARRAVDEGASMIHIHARTPDGAPSHEIEDFRAIADAILAEAGDVILNFSTGALGVSVDKRVAYLRACRPVVAALNMGSMNYAKYSARRRDFVFSAVFANPFD